MNTHELYKNINKHILEDEKPSIYLNEIFEGEVFKQYPFNLLHEMRNTEQSKIHHPEGNVWNHVMMVVDAAAKIKYKSKNERVFMWAALLHDIGKPPTTKIKKGRIISYDHDKVGEELSEKFLSEFTDDKNFIYDVSKLVKYHMHILYVVNKLPFADVENMKKETDVEEIALLGFCDRMGRTNSNFEKEKKNIEMFIKAIS
ncbi:HD domain-containing protein [Sedimentibacter sp. zth1]|uniref:HD domain-containing protein n=1 Tax=Sedimentibacter sp. zth1 TaxID=2816908 RepID=UPI001A928C2D|nr:HD domain-containing protein [Sedimentibacter sp. zth1]QSX06295.1 HD domain-containing protein [Sedimentibacter sp. zth1]